LDTAGAVAHIDEHQIAKIANRLGMAPQFYPLADVRLYLLTLNLY
jgi:hypothetical protein